MRRLPHKLIFNAGGSFGITTLDVTGAIAGWPTVVELKRFDGKGKLTGRQKVDLKEFITAGCITWVVDSEETLDDFVRMLQVLPDRTGESLQYSNYILDAICDG